MRQHSAGGAVVRVLFYCHDTYGLGHLRRTLALARHFSRHWDKASQLIVTGSPALDGCWLPERADVVKLPSVHKVGPGRYTSRSLAVSFDDVLGLRSEILLGAARRFAPDAFIVDHAPAGLKGEALPTLHYLKRRSPSTALVLGLRDVVDEPLRVRRDWLRDGVYDLLDEVYDRVLVFGQSDIYDLVTKYRFSARAARKSRYVGYLRREAERSVEVIRRELRLRTGRLVLVTAGGGEDGHQLCNVMLQALDRRRGSPDFDCLLVTGPFMPECGRVELEALAERLPAVRVITSVRDLAGYVAAADVVVAMAGHNSASEILSFGRPAILVPRLHPRREQLLRAEALSRRGVTRMIHPAELSPDRLLADVDDLLANPMSLRPPFAMDGLAGAASELDDLLFHRTTPVARALARSGSSSR